MAWLETLGFCGKGESGRYVEGGDRQLAGDPKLAVAAAGGGALGGCLLLRGE